MPSFVNLGAYVGEGTMVDTWATVGSCAQIGKNVHLSGGVGIGGVLEPLQANPTIIEDNCFIGARSEVVEGVIVGEGAVLSMGVFIGASTKIIDRATGEVLSAGCRPIRSWSRAALPGKTCRTAAGPVALPAPSSSSPWKKGRAPRPHQRAAAGLNGRRRLILDWLPTYRALARQAIDRPHAAFGSRALSRAPDFRRRMRQDPVCDRSGDDSSRAEWFSWSHRCRAVGTS